MYVYYVYLYREQNANVYFLWIWDTKICTSTLIQIMPEQLIFALILNSLQVNLHFFGTFKHFVSITILEFYNVQYMYMYHTHPGKIKVEKTSLKSLKK